MKEIMIQIPTVALKGMTILPGAITHFDVKKEQSILAINDAMHKGQKLFLITQRNLNSGIPKPEELFEYGVLVEIKQVIKMQGGVNRVLVEGLNRGKLEEMKEADGFLVSQISMIKEEEPEVEMPELEEQAMLRNLLDFFKNYVHVHPKLSKDTVDEVMAESKLGSAMLKIINNIPIDFTIKQKFLEADNTGGRYEVLVLALAKEVNIAEIKTKFQAEVKAKIDKNQKEYILREELKIIREELGEDNTVSDADRYREATKKLQSKTYVKEKLEKEISRFQSIPSSSSESAVIRGYIETLLEMPWDKCSEENLDIQRATSILDQDHYGLEKVKERMLECLAVSALTKNGDSPIVCLVGPPGTGKTSIAHSIARALNKEYVRISLGGVRDEAEIRGHRRTYVGAMPGRIADGLRQAGVANPLMVLDEIDKVSSDYKGDTSSALLEVLDSEQNSKFKDHYMEIPIDLSHVFFIATANSLADIPRPLLDRMEVIEVSSYTENEKFHIGKEFLVPKQLRKNGLDESMLRISDHALQKVIRSYTREAGVRNFERVIGQLCRKAAKQIVAKKKQKVQITAKNLEKYLGKEKISFEMANQRADIGIVRGLAWTSVGGDTLQIEVNVMPGKGELQLTGQLGDVMKESAQAGLSYIRSVGKNYKIQKNYFFEHDIHIHIPEGAVPKDGPSAGVTMATAVLSAICGIPVHENVAMTGEITLRGRVLPIGGLKEKILAAKNAGITVVCVPKKNTADIAELSREITDGLEIIFVEHISEILKVAFVQEEV